IGGENSLSKNVQTQLSNMGISVERISGSDRYKTSISLAQKLNSIKSVSQVAVANGVNGLADAISIGAAA
ncbi:cell wall-binding repeat-containing protein, partial [Clostridioides difficile]